MVRSSSDTQEALIYPWISSKIYAWIIWLALILIFVIIEVISVDFSALMFAVGSVAGLIVSLFPTPFWLQVVIAGVVALLLLFTVRPPLERALNRGGDHARSNVEALMGIAGTVVMPISTASLAT